MGDDWVDLSHNELRQALHADICVVGAGAAGIYLAVELAKMGRSVVLLEAGPRRAVGGEAVGLNAAFDGAPYQGATVGRFFGLGGSTSRWGGLLVPHSRHDIRGEGESKRIWTHVAKVVSVHARAVLRNLHIPQDVDFESIGAAMMPRTRDALRDVGLHVQGALALPFRHKNLVGILSVRHMTGKTPRVFFNAVVSSWSIVSGAGGEARVAGAVAKSPNGNELHVTAAKFVLTAGAIESARMILEMETLSPCRVVSHAAAVGCYLADHLSVSIGDVVSEDLRLATSLFGPRFLGSWMTSMRFLESSPPLGTPRAFSHLIFSSSSPGFALARELFGAMQARRMPAITAERVAASASDLMRLTYHRFVKSELYVPDGTPIHLQLDMEQEPTHSNRVCLSGGVDQYGRPRAKIHWRVSDADTENMRQIARRNLEKWQGRDVGLPRLEPRSLGGDGAKPHDAYHPVGTCRMSNVKDAVVDFDLKVEGIQNLWIASTGVLPSAGSANPTFTLLCLAHNLAHHLHTVH